MFMRAIAAATLAALAGWSGPAAAADASGHVVSVRQQAKASGPAGTRTIDTQGPVFAGDVITTDRRGSAQLLFADQTKMVVGPNSQVTIDDFVLKGPGTASAVSINALRGSFRFITGVSAKNAYKINTPVATIGVRGTEFSGHVADDGTLTLAMWGGAVLLCPGGVCQVVAGTCTLVVVAPGGGVERVNNVYRRTQLMEQRLPFAFRQGWLQSPFRVESRSCNVQNYDPVPDPYDDDDGDGINSPNSDSPPPVYN
jgi:hypothetical protein